MTVTVTREWLERVPLKDDLLDPAAGAFHFEPWSVAEPDPETVSSKLRSVSDDSVTDDNLTLISQPSVTTSKNKTTGEELSI